VRLHWHSYCAQVASTAPLPSPSLRQSASDCPCDPGPRRQALPGLPFPAQDCPFPVVSAAPPWRLARRAFAAPPGPALPEGEVRGTKRWPTSPPRSDAPTPARLHSPPVCWPTALSAPAPPAKNRGFSARPGATLASKRHFLYRRHQAQVRRKATSPKRVRNVGLWPWFRQLAPLGPR